MTAARVKTCVITGYGINCEKEIASACQMAGSDVSFIHAQKLFTDEFPWNDAHLIVFPGGFSFGDELGAGKTFANRIKYNSLNLRDKLHAFANQGNCLLGICNGFQLLIKLGLLPGNNNHTQTLSLTNNRSNRFECRWVHHTVSPSNCVFTQNIQSMYLPVRHGEGNLIGDDTQIRELFSNHQVVLQYAHSDGSVAHEFPSNPNGSIDGIGGLCDSSGRIFGMMAHPEAATRFITDPRWTRLKNELHRNHEPIPYYGDGFPIFKNAINFLRDSK
jgi:phosphoribosylformylglycinamidine synthase